MALHLDIDLPPGSTPLEVIVTAEGRLHYFRSADGDEQCWLMRGESWAQQSVVRSEPDAGSAPAL